MAEQTTSIADPLPRFRMAFEKLTAQIRALPESEMIPITVDVPTAVATVLGVLVEVEPLRPHMAELPGLNHGLLAQLEELTLALGHAHGAYIAASTPPRSLEDLGMEAARVRETLLADAGPLAGRGFIDPARLTDIGSKTGYRNVAFDLLALVSVLRERWPVIAGKTAIQLGELEQAEVLADRLVTAVGVREQAPLTLSAAGEDRQKAFTLFASAYSELRRAIAYLRFHEEDAEKLAPSLYAGKTRKPVPEKGAAREPATAEARPTAPSTAANVPGPMATPGMPGATPFTS